MYGTRSLLSRLEARTDALVACLTNSCRTRQGSWNLEADNFYSVLGFVSVLEQSFQILHAFFLFTYSETVSVMYEQINISCSYIT